MAGKDVAPREENSATRAEKKRRILEMALAGIPLKQIADTLGYRNTATVADILRRLVDQSMSIDAGALEELRKTELSRLDRLQQAHWMNALRGDHRSTDMCLKIIDRRSRLLGLDAPQRVEATVSTDLDREIESMLALLPKPAKG